MTRADLLTCWIAGAPLAALARLLGEEPEALEEGLRVELRRVAAEHAEPQRAPASRSGQKTTAMKARAEQRDLSTYPEAIRDPRAKSRRAVWDVLTGAPQTLAAIAAKAKLDPAAADAALRALRSAGLAVTNGDVPAQWLRRTG